MPSVKRPLAGKTVRIQINKGSEIPLHKQLMEQIIVLIATGHFKPGDALPTVRQLARQNGIHYNTVSRAYRELVADGWLLRQAGRALTVRSPDSAASPPRDLDDLIDMTIRLARECGYTIEQLGGRLMERLAAQPDHLLVVSTDPGIGELLRSELKPRVSCRVEACTLDAFAADSRVTLGAIVVCLQGGESFVKPFLPKGCPLVSVPICDPGEVVQIIQDMREPSIIGLVSISKLFLQRATGMLAPAVGDRHTLQAHLLTDKVPVSLRSADLVLCASVAFRRVKARNPYEYRLISPGSVQKIRDTLGLSASSRLPALS